MRVLLHYLPLPFLTPGLYSSGIQNHLIAMIQNQNYYEKTFLSTHSNCLARISIEIRDGSPEQLDEGGSKLTAPGTILVRMQRMCAEFGGRRTNITMSPRFWQPMSQPLVASLSMLSLAYPLLSSRNQSAIRGGESAGWADYQKLWKADSYNAKESEVPLWHQRRKSRLHMPLMLHFGMAHFSLECCFGEIVNVLG